MRRDIKEDIKSLRLEIIDEETRVLEFLRQNNYTQLRKSLARINSDLRYLSILANGAPIDKKEDMKIMEFLRVHYENFHNLSLPA